MVISLPRPGYIVTETMTERLFIMVCRHFAYAGTINKILPFREEFETILLETSYYNRQLYQALHGLLIPFRVGRLPASAPIIQIWSLQTPNGLISTD